MLTVCVIRWHLHSTCSIAGFPGLGLPSNCMLTVTVLECALFVDALGEEFIALYMDKMASGNLGQV